MVLQRAPAQAAVYGVHGPKATSPAGAKVTVTVTANAGSADAGSSYTVDAEMDTVKQAALDPLYAACTPGTECPPA